MNKSYVAVTAALLFISTNAFAGANSRYSHCYKIKDTQAKAEYSLDLVQNDFRFPDIDGCTIKTPAKLLCVDSFDIGLTPTPPAGAPGGYNGQKYLCYKAKCPAPATAPVVGVGDALGIRVVTASKTQQVCIPVVSDTCVSNADCRARPNMTTAACGTGGFCEVAACAAGYDDCDEYFGDGCETSTNTDPYSCGECGNLCSFANGYADCTAGTCTLNSCETDYADCDVDGGNGCEAYLPSDPSNCGGCGTVCAAPNGTAACSSSTCTIGSCDTGYGDCNSNPTDGCEVYVDGNDVNNCGGCNIVCPGSCVSGICTP